MEKKVNPLDTSLELALSENLNHARHQEEQREKYTQWYWIVWGSVLAFIGRDGTFIITKEENLYLFGFLFAISLLSLIANLKWNAEFANHMAAVASISRRLALNNSTPEQERTSNKPLPYAEFKGYMALPLKFPIQYSVGAWLSIIQCFGLFCSAFFLLFRLTGRFGCSLLIAIIIGAIGIVICYDFFIRMSKNVKSRIPTAEQDVQEIKR